MIRGKTKIELYDVNKKIKQIVESENTFQKNVLGHQFPMNPWLKQNPFNNSEFNNSPIVAMVGGLLLFKEPIQVGKVYMPSGNVMVGNAANGIVNTGNPNELGSYNSAESSLGDTSFTQVFDFTTSQANGNIACACLTSKWGGYAGYGNTSLTAKTDRCDPDKYHENTNTQSIQLAENGKGYTFSVSEDVITVNKYRLISTVGSVFHGRSTATTHDVSGENDKITIYGTIVDLIPHYIGNNKFALMPVGLGTGGGVPINIATGQSFYWWEYNCANDTITRKSFVNPSSDTLQFYFWTNGGGAYKFIASAPIFFRDGNVALRNSSSTAILIFKTSNGELVYKTQVDRYIVANANSGIWIMGELTDGLYIAQSKTPMYGNNYYLIDTVNGTEKPINFCTNFGYYEYNVQLVPTDYDGQGLSRFLKGDATAKRDNYIAQNPFYLATINNLDSYVTKTASQTMKVTYTLSEE